MGLTGITHGLLLERQDAGRRSETAIMGQHAGTNQTSAAVIV